MILSPERSPKQPLPGIGLQDFLHYRQACPKFNSFHQGVGQISPREGLLSCRPFPKRGQRCDIPSPPQSLNDSINRWQRSVLLTEPIACTLPSSLRFYLVLVSLRGDKCKCTVYRWVSIRHQTFDVGLLSSGNSTGSRVQQNSLSLSVYHVSQTKRFDTNPLTAWILGMFKEKSEWV